ncbi:MAG: ABC transporter substrate-binding protein [Desulfitobacteriia bacterium]
MRKILPRFLVLILILAFMVSCSSQGNENSQGKIIKDTLGREINITSPPEKIVSLSPALTEILFAIGLDQEIIGVSEYCNYPAAAKNKPTMGDFSTPNVELVTSKDPDMVFVAAGVQEDVIEKFESLGITVVVLDADTIEQVIDNIELAGILTGKEKEAARVAEDMRKRLEAITAKVQNLEKPKVFFEVWDDPLMSAGSQSFIHDIIVTAGGENIAGKNTERYYNYSVETLLEENPDIYLINSHSHTPSDIKKRNGYQVLQAVKNDKIFVIDDDLISRPGPRVIEGLEQLARYFHPQAFKE